MAREPFLSFSEHECGQQPVIYTQGFNYDYINSHNFSLCCELPGGDVVLAFIHPPYITKQTQHRERWLISDSMQPDIFCLANVYTLPKLIPHPAAANPLLKISKRKQDASLFGSDESECRCCILPSLHLLTGGHRLYRSERTGTCHSTSGGCSHNHLEFDFRGGASSQC